MVFGRLALTALLLAVAAATQVPDTAPNAASVAIVPIALDAANDIDRQFLAVAADAARFHHGATLAWDGGDTAALAGALRALAPPPTAVLFCVRPERLDVMLHRRILLALCALDEDPLVDATFGYLTARDAQALRSLWQRTEAMHREGLRTKVWHSAGVASGMKSTVYPGHRSDLERAAGFAGDSFYFGCVEQDPEVRQFVAKALPKLATAAVLEWSGNGDPQGIWLFDGNRNRDRSRHWDYDPRRVGEDPRGEMPRLTADIVRTMQLPGTIVWSGTCHSAATHRIYLEGDIVSTFGRARPGTVHEMPLAQGLGLAFLDAGATAVLAPIGPNHGLSAMRESEFALREGASLGEAVKSSYDDVVLAAKGVLRLDLVVDGKRVENGEPIMQGGGANRVLLGDPTLRPFVATRDARETVTVGRGPAAGFTVQVDWVAGFHARAWDMYGTDRTRGACVPVRLAVGDLLPATTTKVAVAVLASDASGASLPFALTHAVFESFAGRRHLHLQANADRKLVEGKPLRVTFTVTPEPH